MFNPNKFLAQPGFFAQGGGGPGYGGAPPGTSTPVDPGYDTSAPSGGMSTEDMLAEQYRRQQEMYEQYYMPMIEDLEKEQDSRQFVEDASLTAVNMEANALEQAGRAQSRQVGGMTAAQQADAERGIATTSATSGSALMNSAKDQQRSRNEAITGDIMSISNAMATGSTADLAGIAGNEAQRQAQYEAQKAASKGSVLGLVGGVAGAIIGGPAGAAVGSGIGSAIGSRF